MRLLRSLIALVAAISGGAAFAQAFPSKPITFVVAYQPGGTNDILARTVAARMTETLGVPVLVENRPGFGGNLGAQHVARAPADGYTVLTASSGMLAINRWIYANAGFDPEKDFAPITLGGKVANVLVAGPTVPIGGLAIYLVTIVVMLWRPQGLMGRAA